MPTRRFNVPTTFSGQAKAAETINLSTLILGASAQYRPLRSRHRTEPYEDTLVGESYYVPESLTIAATSPFSGKVGKIAVCLGQALDLQACWHFYSPYSGQVFLVRDRNYARFIWYEDAFVAGERLIPVTVNAPAATVTILDTLANPIAVSYGDCGKTIRQVTSNLVTLTVPTVFGKGFWFYFDQLGTASFEIRDEANELYEIEYFNRRLTGSNTLQVPSASGTKRSHWKLIQASDRKFFAIFDGFYNP